MALAYQAFAFNGTSGGATKTFSGVSIGTAAANRYVMVIAGDDAAEAVTGLTIAGNAATEVYSATQAGVSGQAVYILNVPTGTTADIAVTYNADPGTGNWVAVWTDVDVDTTIVDSVENEQAGTGNPSVTISTAATGFVLANVNHNNDGASSITWTNATEDYDTAYRFDSRSSGANAAATGGNITITATRSGGNGHHLIAVSFQYAGATVSTKSVGLNLLGVGQ